MRKSINEGLALLGEIAQLSDEISMLFDEYCYGGRYDDVEDVESMIIEAGHRMLLKGDVEITLSHEYVSKNLWGIFRRASQADDQKTATMAESLLYQLIALKEKIGGKK